MSHDHSYEEDFMKEMSFDLEDEPTNPQANINGNNTPKELDPIQKEQAQIKKPVTKISLNLKAKFMPENPENNKDNNYFHENPGKNMGEGYKENLIKENNDQIMVPGFLLNNKISGGEASTSAIMKQVFPNRYFILKKLTKTQLEICMESNYCVISLAFKKKLHDAYQNAENVYLIFSNTDAKQFLGYARMISEPENFDYLPDNLLELLSSECTPTTHCVVRVEKQASNLVPFELTKDFRNEFNNKSPVFYCKECQEVDKETAQKLCNILDQSSLSPDFLEHALHKNNEDLPLPPQLSSSHNNPSSPSHMPVPRQVQRPMNPGFPGPPGAFMMPPPFYPSYMFPPGDFGGGFPPMFPMDYGGGVPFGGGKTSQTQAPSLMNHLGLFSMSGGEQLIGGLGFNSMMPGTQKKNKDSKSSEEKEESNKEDESVRGKKKRNHSSHSSQHSKKKKRNRYRSRSRSHNKQKKKRSSSFKRRRGSNSKIKTVSKERREKDRKREKERSHHKEKKERKEKKHEEQKNSDKKSLPILNKDKDESVKESNEKKSSPSREKEPSFAREESSVDIFELMRDVSKKENNANSPVRKETRSNKEDSKEKKRKYKEKSKEKEKTQNKREKDRSRKKDKYREKHKKSRSRSRSHEKTHRSRSYERTQKKNKKNYDSQEKYHEKSTVKYKNPSRSNERVKKIEDLAVKNSSNSNNFLTITPLISFNNDSPKITPQKMVRLSSGRVLTKESSIEMSHEEKMLISEARLNDLREKITLKKQIKGSITNRIIKKGNN